jgi:hypothetical protein
MEFRGLFFSSLLIALIAMGITIFIIGLQSNYSVDNGIKDDQEVSYLTDLQDNVTTIFSNSNSSQGAFYSQSPNVDSGGLMLTTIVSAGQIFSSSISLIYNIIVVGAASSLGISSSILLIIEAMMMGGVVLLAWSLYRLGR